MVASKKRMIAFVVLVLGIGIYFLMSPGETDRIKKQYDLISTNIGKAPDENKIMGAAKAKRIREVVTETVTIQAPAYDYSRELAAAELPALVLSARAPYEELALSYYDFTFEFPQDSLADVRVTSRLQGQLASGETVEDIQELVCQWRKIEGSWRLAAVEIVEVLEK